MKTSARGIAHIKRMEGFRAKAYQDIVGVWTIGYGFTKGVKEGDTLTLAQADKRLIQELRPYERAVWEATHGRVTQPQFDALVGLTYNIGIAGLQRSTVIRRHNEGNYRAAARAFALWNKAGGREVAGLTRRRALEAAMYLTPDVPPQTDEASQNEDERTGGQTVESERPMSASQINRAATVAGGTAALATVADTARTAADIKTSADLLGAWLVPILLMVVVGLCIYIVTQRRKQREEGWA